jgi:hypothetical protein
MAHLGALQLIHGYGVITTALVTVEKTMTSMSPCHECKFRYKCDPLPLSIFGQIQQRPTPQLSCELPSTSVADMSLLIMTSMVIYS